MSAGRMQVRLLPNDRFVIVFDNMPRTEADVVADFEVARQALLTAGAAVVLRFDHPVDVA